MREIKISVRVVERHAVSRQVNENDVFGLRFGGDFGERSAKIFFCRRNRIFIARCRKRPYLHFVQTIGLARIAKQTPPAEPQSVRKIFRVFSGNFKRLRNHLEFDD